MKTKSVDMKTKIENMKTKSVNTLTKTENMKTKIDIANNKKVTI